MPSKEEVKLIERLQRIVASACPDLLAGIGDHVAVIAEQGVPLALVSVDS